MNFITKEVLQRLREEYPIGARVELTKMNDPYRTDLVSGCRGTVMAVDDIGTIHVAWDCGSSLGGGYGEDACRRLDYVTVTCYGITKVWDERISAIRFYTLCTEESDGSERVRYMNIIYQLVDGNMVCTDGEESE